MPLNVNQASVTLSGTTTSSSAAIPAENTKRFIRVVNLSAAIAYVATGTTTATATLTSMPVGPNTTEIFEKPSNHDTVAVIMSTGTGTVVVSPCGEPTF